MAMTVSEEHTERLLEALEAKVRTLVTIGMLDAGPRVPVRYDRNLARGRRSDGPPDLPVALAELEAVEVLRGLLDRIEATAVGRAKGAGASFTQLGDAVGISRQAARKRFA